MGRKSDCFDRILMNQVAKRIQQQFVNVVKNTKLCIEIVPEAICSTFLTWFPQSHYLLGIFVTISVELRKKK